MQPTIVEVIEKRYKPIALAGYCDQWIREVNRHLEMACQTLTDIGVITFDDLTEETIDLWWALTSKKLPPVTANKVLVRFKNVCRRATRWKLLKYNPALELKTLDEKERPFKHLTAYQRMALITESPEKLKAYVIFAQCTGQRRGSLYRLTKHVPRPDKQLNGDIDLMNGEFIFRDTKNGEDHRVPIHPRLYDEKRYPETAILGQLLSIPIKHKKHTQHPQLLPRYACVESISRQFCRVARRVGVPGFRFHDLRHDVGTRMAALNINQKVIMDVLGHKDPEMTLRYTHTNLAIRSQAMEAAL